MRALIDTNVLLDAIFRREPFFEDSKKVFEMARDGKIEGYISVQSLKDIFYLCKKINGREHCFDAIEKLSFLFKVVDVTGQDSFSALMSDIDDYEDGLLIFSAKRNNIDAIITRNGKDFVESDIILIDPKNIDRYFDDLIEVGNVS